jgi:hypothetical protein
VGHLPGLRGQSRGRSRTKAILAPKTPKNRMDQMSNPYEHWHLDKKVPLTLIFAMMAQAGAVIWAVADIKKDVELVKADITNLHRDDAKQTEELRNSLRTVQEQYLRLDGKLDRLIERRERP